MRPNRLIAFLVLLALAGCKDGSLLPDQFGSIQGTVVDFATGAPIQGAGVTTTPATDATVTDANGAFTVPDALVGSYTITANRNGYAANTATVSVREARTAQATVFLKADTDPGTGGPPTQEITAEVTNFFNRRIVTTRGDSNVVVIDYRVRNTGSATVDGYQVIFRIVTPAGDFFQDVNRTTLAVGQSAVGRVEKDAGGALATDVRVDDFFITGQPRPARPTAQQRIRR